MRNPHKSWIFSILLILLFIILGETVTIFNDYFYYRLRINRNIFLVVLWVLPFLSSFIISYYSEGFKSLLSLSYIFFIPLMGSVVHYILGQSGNKVDFTGFSGAITLFKVYFFLCAFLVTFGVISGILLKNRPSQHRRIN